MSPKQCFYHGQDPHLCSMFTMVDKAKLCMLNVMIRLCFVILFYQLVKPNTGLFTLSFSLLVCHPPTRLAVLMAWVEAIKCKQVEKDIKITILQSTSNLLDNLYTKNNTYNFNIHYIELLCRLNTFTHAINPLILCIRKQSYENMCADLVKNMFL